MRSKRQLTLLLLSAMLVLGGLTAGCSPSNSASDEHPFDMADLAEMPLEVQSASVSVQQAYQFAVANPDVTQHIPCYCGCGVMGHTSNHACYVAATNADGSIEFDPHALGCSICVDITLDAMRLLKQGQSVADIRAYIDATYSRFGPSNMP